jgi:hypothetical protein
MQASISRSSRRAVPANGATPRFDVSGLSRASFGEIGEDRLGNRAGSPIERDLLAESFAAGTPRTKEILSAALVNYQTIFMRHSYARAEYYIIRSMSIRFS